MWSSYDLLLTSQWPAQHRLWCVFCCFIIHDHDRIFWPPCFKFCVFSVNGGPPYICYSHMNMFLSSQLLLVAATNYLLPSAPINFEMMVAYMGYASWLNGVVQRFSVTKAIQWEAGWNIKGWASWTWTGQQQEISKSSTYCIISTYSLALVTCDHHEEMKIYLVSRRSCDFLDISSERSPQ